MNSIRQVRRLLIAATVLFIVLDAAAIAFLLSPAGRSRTARQEQYSVLRTEMLNKRRENLPARDMDGKLKSAREQVSAFYQERLPSYYSQISEALEKDAAENHVKLASVHYQASPPGTANSATGLQRVELSLDVDGSYADEMRFLNAIERSKVFFIPAQVNFGGQQGGGGNTMRVTLRLLTYMRKNAS